MLAWALPVLATSWVIRFLFVMILPAYAYSWDISSWYRVAEVLADGENPYATTTFLNWPPLWMVCVYWMSRLSEAASLELITVIRVVLVAFESVTIVLAGLLIERISPQANVRRILLIGLALNPVSVFIVCQHGNFDVIATTFVMSALLALGSHLRSGDDPDWLLACLSLGLAVLTKTYPLALAPLLLPGFRSASWRSRFLGGSLLLGPTALGMAVIHALAPEAITRNVLNYRSRPGTFGMSGLADLLDWQLLHTLAGLASWALMVAILAGAILAWRWQRPTEADLVLLSSMVLLAIPTLGPGFGAQYAAWFIAPVTASFAVGSTRWRRAVVASYVVSAVTYFVLYGYASDLGQFMTFLSGTGSERALAKLVRTFPGQALISLPMFICWMALLTIGVLDLATRIREAGAHDAA